MTGVEEAVWLEERRKSVGASEAAAVLGCSPWSTPLETFWQKQGLETRKSTPGYLLWGQKFEPVVASIYSEQSGNAIVKAPPINRHPQAPWMHASLDYIGSDRPVEIKRVIQQRAKEFGPSGSQEIPHYVALQLQQQMACTGYRVADLAAFIGWDDLRIYEIPRNDEVIAKLIDVEQEFMDRVARNDPPLPDFQHPTTADILAMIEPEIGTRIELDDLHQTMADDYVELGELQNRTGKTRDEIKSRLIYAMGTAEKAFLPDGRCIVRSTVNRKAYPVAATSYVSFRVQKNGEK